MREHRSCATVVYNGLRCYVVINQKTSMLETACGVRPVSETNCRWDQDATCLTCIVVEGQLPL